MGAAAGGAFLSLNIANAIIALVEKIAPN